MEKRTGDCSHMSSVGFTFSNFVFFLSTFLTSLASGLATSLINIVPEVYIFVAYDHGNANVM